MLIWAVAAPARMPSPVREAVAAPGNQVFVSAASVWEIAIKRAAGRLVFPIERFDEIALRMGFEVLAILPRHAVMAAELPRHHGDPFDRMLIAQTVAEQLELVTVDREIARYDVKIFNGTSN